MTWTYVPADLETTPLYQIRFLIGDIVSTEPLVQDEEITFALIRRNSINGAVALVCRAISAKFSRLSDTTVNEQKHLLSQKAEAYAKRADEYEALDDSTGGATPFLGGASCGDKAARDSDTDRVKPGFVKNMTDYAVAGGQNPDGEVSSGMWGLFP